MSASRKGLKREGQRSYRVVGPDKEILIMRDRPWRWFVRPASFPQTFDGFFAMQFPRLCEARAYAEREAGVARPFDLVRDMPKFLRRKKCAE